MQFDLKSAKIVGDLEGNKWSQVLSEGNLLLLLEVSPQTGQSSESTGKSLLDEVLAKIHQSHIDSLASLKALFSQFLENEKITTLILGVVFENILYLAVKNGRVLIKRDGKIINLAQGQSYISGFLKKDDYFLFTSKSFNEAIPYLKEEEILKSTKFVDIAEVLAPLILEDKDSSGYAALAVYLETTTPALNLENEENLTRTPKFPSPLFQIKQKISSIFRSPKLFDQGENVYQNEKELKSKKTLFTIAAVLIVLLILSIFFGLNNNNTKTKTADFNKNMENVTHQIDEAQGLIDLNSARSRELLTQANSTLTSLQKSYNKNSKEYKDIQSLLDKIKSIESLANKVYKLESVPTFFDINLLRANGEGTAMSLYNKNILILDTKNKVIYRLSIANKQSDIIAGVEMVKDAKFIAIHGGTGFILNSDGIVSVDTAGKTAKTVIKKDEAWGDIGSLIAFAGNLYLLDKTHNQIDKYIATVDGFTPRASYLNSDVTADFSKAKSMAIDGSVWVLTGNVVTKFTQGRPEQFTLHDLVGDITSASQIYADDNTKNIYILDPPSSRIIAFGKDGAYQSAYQWNGLKNASSFVVSEDDKKIFVLSGSKIYAIDIK